jgi:hypothetical protein
MQFGNAHNSIIQDAAGANPQHGIVDLSKCDLADAFMRASLSPSMIQTLEVAVPMELLDEKTLIAFPLVLLMGWIESPPAFCTVTETIADLGHSKIVQGYNPAPYQYHKAMANIKPEIIWYSKVVHIKGFFVHIQGFLPAV